MFDIVTKYRWIVSSKPYCTRDIVMATTRKIDEIPTNSIEEHNRKTSEARSKVKAALITCGYNPDDNVKFVNDQYVGLYILPSVGHLCVGFGKCGNKIAFRGVDTDFDPMAVAKLIVGELRTTNQVV